MSLQLAIGCNLCGMFILGLCAAAVVRFTYFGKDDAPSDPFFYILTFYMFPFAGLLLVAQL